MKTKVVVYVLALLLQVTPVSANDAPGACSLLKSEITESAAVDPVDWWEKNKYRLIEGSDYQEEVIRVFSRTHPGCWQDIEHGVILQPGWWLGWLSTKGTWTIDKKNRAEFGPEGFGVAANNKFFSAGNNQGCLVGYYPNGRVEKLSDLPVEAFLYNYRWPYKGLFPNGWANTNVSKKTIELRFFINDIWTGRSGRDKRNPYMDNDGCIECKLVKINLDAARKKLLGFINPNVDFPWDFSNDFHMPIPNVTFSEAKIQGAN